MNSKHAVRDTANRAIESAIEWSRMPMIEDRLDALELNLRPIFERLIPVTSDAATKIFDEFADNDSIPLLINVTAGVRLERSHRQLTTRQEQSVQTFFEGWITSTENVSKVVGRLRNITHEHPRGYSIPTVGRSAVAMVHSSFLPLDSSRIAADIHARNPRVVPRMVLRQRPFMQAGSNSFNRGVPLVTSLFHEATHIEQWEREPIVCATTEAEWKQAILKSEVEAYVAGSIATQAMIDQATLAELVAAQRRAGLSDPQIALSSLLSVSGSEDADVVGMHPRALQKIDDAIGLSSFVLNRF